MSFPSKQSISEATAEAEARPLEYDPATRAFYIRSMLQGIQQKQSENVSDEKIAEEFSEFKERYSELYRKIIEKQDLTPVQSMLAMLDRMGEGNLSQHQASVIIGKKLVERYVKPQLNGDDKKKPAY